MAVNQGEKLKQSTHINFDLEAVPLKLHFKANHAREKKNDNKKVPAEAG